MFERIFRSHFLHFSADSLTSATISSSPWLSPFFFFPPSPPSAEKEFVLSLVISSPKWKEGTTERGGENDDGRTNF